MTADLMAGIAELEIENESLRSECQSHRESAARNRTLLADACAAMGGRAHDMPLASAINELHEEKNAAWARVTALESEKTLLRVRVTALESGAEYAAMAETLGRAQTRGTEALDAARGWRRCLAASWSGHAVAPSEPRLLALEAIVVAAWRAEAKHGSFHPRLTHIPDVREIEALPDLASASSILEDVRTACSAAEKDGTVSWALLALEEMLEALVEALRGDVPALRTEVAQLGCVCAAWLEAIERRGSK